MTDLVCSATACREAATRAVVWNNPRLHSPERRKVWTACPAHAQYLEDFVAARGFHRETIDVQALTQEDG